MVKILGRKRRHAADSSVEHERLLSLVNSMADGVIAVDQNLNVAVSNGAALNILDVNDSLIGKPLSDILNITDKNNQKINIDHLVNSVKTSTSSRDLHLTYSDGSKVNLYLSIAPVHLGYGERGQKGFVLLMRDITREKSLEEERDEFISVVSHELRTPIAISEGNISNAQFILEKTSDLNTIKGTLKEAHDQIVYLAGLVNDLATLSRAERGKLNVDITEINVAELVKKIVASYASQAKQHNLELEVVAKDPLNPLFTSELYFKEILQNFMTNALKYTETGKITITAEQYDKGAKISVKDTGIGISKSDQEKLFDKFFRSEDYRTRKTNGTGLGLYVAMKLARLLHADIDVNSQLNEGSIFSVRIPNLK